MKTWAMRGTLHLIAASDLPLYVAARSLFESRGWVKYFDYYGISQPLYETFLAAAPRILGSEPLTREQLAAALAEHTGSRELENLVLTKGWGTPLKPLAWRGDLCFGPNQGRSVTFVHPGKWTGSWQSEDLSARRGLRGDKFDCLDQYCRAVETTARAAKPHLRGVEEKDRNRDTVAVAVLFSSNPTEVGFCCPAVVSTAGWTVALGRERETTVSLGLADNQLPGG